MVAEEHAHIVIGSASQVLAAGCSSQDRLEIRRSHILALVVNVATGINIDSRSASSGWLVEELARERILAVVGNVVISHHNDV